MKKVILILTIVLCFNFVGCSSNNFNKISNTEKKVVENELANNLNNETTVLENNMIMEIDGVQVDVTWENNSSVNDLKKLATNGLTISMHQYGGFEQVGQIGKNISTNNCQINTICGDVCLYNGNQIVIFFGTNSWSYTKLAHINLNQNELELMLNKSSVTLILKV